jgi:type II secretory pathway component PulF
MDRAGFYRQLAQFTDAGLGLIRALQHLETSPPNRSYRQPISRVLKELTGGFSLSESLQRVAWLPEFDIALLNAGEQSGRLEPCLRLLADYYEDRARMARQMIADLMYPVLLFHLAVFIFPFSAFFISGNWLTYLTNTVGVLLPIYFVTGLLIYAAQSSHGEMWRSWIEIFLDPFPLLGTGRRQLALSRLAAALEALLSAGVTIIEAWGLAAKASGSPALRRTVASWLPMLHAGQTPAEMVSTSRRFPELFASQYSTGEVSGKLDDTLRRLHRYYQEEGSQKIRATSRWTPRAIYMIVMLLIAWRVVKFWTGYFQSMGL